MESRLPTVRAEWMITILMVVLIAVLLIAQARLLYLFPQPDSTRWWGDETGQMLELRAELQDGYARIPTALGASVAITNGLVRGNSWLAAIVYGVPGLLFSAAADLVTIGRSVTFILSIGLLVAVYGMLRTNQVPRVRALGTIVLLVTTRSFFYASHAARLDLAAGLTVLLFVWYLSSRVADIRLGRWKPTNIWYFFYGAIAMLFATLSIHLLSLLGALSIYMLLRFGAFRKPSAILASAAGVAITVGFLLAIYAISGAPISLFGPSTAPNQFQSVVTGLPILRPFSRSVQWANILERLHGLWFEAPAFLAIMTFAFASGIIRRISRVQSNNGNWISGAAIVIAVGWLLFESPALYYYIQVLPLFMVAMVIGISRRWKSDVTSLAIVAALALVLFYFGFTDTTHAGRMAESIDHDNHTALMDALAMIHENESASTPIVLAQNPAIAMLEQNRSIRLMTPHLVSFPASSEPVANVLRSLNVRYLLLYAAQDGSVYSADYRVLRPVADSMGRVVLRTPGILFDNHRDYFAPIALNHLGSQDTLIVYQLPTP